MSLKIAYIYLRIMLISGVDKKPIQQAAAIKKLGIKDFDVIVLNPEVTKEADGVKYYKYKTFPKPFHYLDYIFKHNFWRYKIFDECLDLKKYDYLILRYPGADRTGKQLFINNRIITEHHTRETIELLLEASTSKHIHIKLLKYLRYYLEKTYADKMLSNAKGLIAVSNIPKKYQVERISKEIPAVTIGNGTNVESIPFTKFAEFDNKTLNIAMVGSSYVPWYGVERIIEGMNKYSGKIKIILHLIGGFSSKFKESENIKLHGILKGEDFDNVMSRMNLAVSSLALYTCHGDGSNLKVREYVARGIPFIIASKDPDLNNKLIKHKFFIEFPNDSSLIDFDKVIDFVAKLNAKYSIDELSIYMRNYAEKYMDWTVKMKQYYEFVEKIHSGEFL